MMDDSEFLRDLARAAREEEAEEHQRWDRWDRLTDGVLSPEEEAELRALAATSVEDEKAFEAFRPLGSDFRDQMVETIRQLLPVPVEPVRVTPAVDPVPVKPPRPVPFPWRRMRFVGPVLATAAMLLFSIRLPDFIRPLPQLPQYRVAEVRPGVEPRRSVAETPTALPVLEAGGKFTAIARPKTRISSRAKVAPRCYVLKNRSDQKKLRSIACEPTVEPDKRGSMEITGSLPEDLTAGPATLWIVLAYRGEQPEADEIEKLPTDRPTRRRKWDAEPTPVEIRAP